MKIVSNARPKLIEHFMMLKKQFATINLYLYNTNSVCVSVEYRRPNCWTDHDQIWHAYADRPGNGSYQILAPWMAWKRGVTGANIRIGT